MLNRIQPDILHLITIKPVLIGGIAARISATPATIMAISELGSIFLAKGIIAGFRRFLVKQIYHFALNSKRIRIIFQNIDDKNTISKLVKLSDHQVEIIPGSGVDLELFNYKTLFEGRPIVMLASRLLRDKGIYEFLLKRLSFYKILIP